jgi:hypothetical protein
VYRYTRRLCTVIQGVRVPLYEASVYRYTGCLCTVIQGVCGPLYEASVPLYDAIDSDERVISPALGDEMRDYITRPITHRRIDIEDVVTTLSITQ